MNRRDFLKTTLLASAAAGAVAAAPRQIPIGFNTYCLRALKWNDTQSLEYAASQKLDAIFLQDSLDPAVNEPSHWPKVREQAKQLGLHLETGASGASLPPTPDGFDVSVRDLRQAI